MSDNPIIIFHGWSDQAASFDRLAGILREKLKREVEEVFLVDWLSLNDEVTYADLTVALQRAWKAKNLPNGPQSVDVIIHSTGALVIRDWMTRYVEPEKNPIDHLLMLAPANFGSPLAHKGRAFYGRIIKGWRNGFENGDRILSGLELASDYTWELAEKDMLSSKYWYGPKRVKATVLVGNQGYSGVKAAANEDGGDGTVRVSTANLNVNKIKIDLASERKDSQNRFTRHPANPHHEIAFGILDGETHGSIVVKEAEDQETEDAKIDIMKRALAVDEAGWDRWCKFLTAKRQALSHALSDTDDDYKHEYVNIVTRVTDDAGNPVPDYFIEFFDGDEPDKSFFGASFHKEVIKTVHRHKEHPSNRSIYLDLTKLKKLMAAADFKNLNIRIHAEPQIDPQDPAAENHPHNQKLKQRRVGYSGHRQVTLSKAEVLKEFIPHQTLLIEIVLKREMVDLVLVKSGEA